MFRTKFVEKKNENTQFILNFVRDNRDVYVITWGKYDRARQATCHGIIPYSKDARIHTRTHTHTRITFTVAPLQQYAYTNAPLNITLYVLCPSRISHTERPQSLQPPVCSSPKSVLPRFIRFYCCNPHRHVSKSQITDKYSTYVLHVHFVSRYRF
jgi:hypothetical protein